ncbi:helix-turn-helix transcriptional regulator [Streptomyces sp. NPDC048717]|uniref:helix-turn-helix domain-containing protein n=1 Tax=Streptomyces sp. NPDC048717 TaxID=3154928 RepID=UPI0034244A18
MSTDFQHSREALGARLRDLRIEGGLNGKQFAELLGWPASKVSRLENGKQTATPDDLAAWALAAGAPESRSELQGRLRGLETHNRSWRRQLAAGQRAVQEANAAQEANAEILHIFESSIVPGIFQTPEYARGVLTDVANRHGAPRDIEAGVRARMKRQDALYQPGHRFHTLVWEAALYTVRCDPAAMAAQLDRLAGVIGLETVAFGVIPLGTRTPFSPKHGFWIIDDRLVIADTWNAELWLDAAEDVALYRKMWHLMSEAAVFDRQIHRLLDRARRALAPS